MVRTLPIRPSLNERERRFVVRVPAPCVVDDKLDVVFFAGRNHGVGFGETGGNGFLAKDCLYARLNRRLCHRRMQRRVRTDGSRCPRFSFCSIFLI